MSGNATVWDPDLDSSVNDVALSDDGSAVFAGGVFTTVGTDTRAGVAVIDAETGDAQAAHPDPDGLVFGIAPTQDTLYVAGGFAHVGGRERPNIAEFSAFDLAGDATLWNPQADATMSAVARSGGLVYLGGSGTVTTIGGKSRNNLAAVGAATGTANGWNPDVNAGVDTLSVSSKRVYAGGSFTSIGGLDQTGFASFSEPAKLRVDNVRVTEGNSGTKLVRFHLRLSRADEETMVVGFATKDGSARWPADYGFTKGFLVFLPGQRAKMVGVKVKADVLAEENETFLLKVSAADNVAIADGTGRATIVDDD